ncbi:MULTISPECIES: protein kinase [unclassified Streptomyces]|uniref:protein kinase n=1 Tax=unclassified Streptomyces TaxID=2593676 RepID=UPI0001C1AB42|nr:MULTISPECIES: protein kinase [unclassified Streptomyces]MYR65081.1 protein kinase [Streptomyces sp. SID4939]MYT65166.1 protein kinase [Streptomyces sp. SID8357]MYT84958.1 protein kinase [Streptomyces sp. SID8360]MYW39346.1 protein kinase [Streptomyces sp. SID1]AEN11887.1 serine/threonine protein kinase [Streptomyces sp. SirexAA-E]
MDDYAGRVLADRYRLPLPPSDAYELVETRAFDTYSGQEVLVRQVPLPEVVDAEVLDADGVASAARRATGRTVRRSTDPAVRRAIEAAQAAAQVPDHPRLDQVFDVFAEAGSLWIVSELVAARPLAALLAERPLNPYRAAEIGSDVLTALRVLHAHGWTHRNITARTVLVCDDGRVVLTGLAAGAAEEALCGYVPVPRPEEEGGYGPPAVETGPTGPYEGFPAEAAAPETPGPPTSPDLPEPRELHQPSEPRELFQPSEPRGLPQPPEEDGPGPASSVGVPASREPLEIEPSPSPYVPPVGRPGPERQELVPRPAHPAVPLAESKAEPGAGSAAQLRAARAGAIAAYRAGARAAARAHENPRREDGADAASPAAPGPDARPGTPSGADGGTGAGPAEGMSWGRIPGPADGSGAASADGPGARSDDAPPAPRSGSTGDGGSGSEDTPGPPGPGVPGRPQLSGAWGRPAELPFHGPYGDGDPYDDEGEDEDDEGPEGPRPPGRRVHLAGTWDDGPGAGRPVPAGGSTGGFGRDELRADSRRGLEKPETRGDGRADRLPQPVGARASAGGWDEVVAGGGDTPAYRGPATPLAAERARQARIAVVGAVTERWAPEQAGPVHDNWQLAPPIGPSTDLWALGALLYRAVQGHAPYPEENAAELVQMVCGEPPAFAEECGPLRPVVESLLRQDPTERPDFEELRGWLRSLVRSAPEPEAGIDVVSLPPTDTTRLPVVRRRGELVRRGWGRGSAHGRHRQGRRQRLETTEQPRYEKPPRAPREPKGPKVLRTPPPARQPGGRSPRRLGRLLLVLILLLMAAAVVYAFVFMPGADSGTGTDTGARDRPTGSAAPADPGPDPDPGRSPSGGASASSGAGTGSQRPQTSRSAVALAPGYALRKDAEGFEIGVPKDFQRSPANADRQVRYGSDGFSVLVVPGRDTVKANGSDPLDYQRSREPELEPFRASSWASSSGLRRVDVGQQVMAEGQFTWQESNGREVYVRNLVMIVSGRYHIVQVIGPEDERDKVTDIYEQAVSSYRVGA